MLTRKNLFLLPILSLLLFACDSNPLDVDVSDVKLEIDYVDMRTAMHDYQGTKLMKTHRQYKKEIPDIYNYFLGACMGFKEGYTDSTFEASMRNFRMDEGVKLFEGEIDAKFKKLKPIEEKLTDGFKHIKYHLPNAKMPSHIVFMNSLFRSSVWVTENEIGVGLGNYLGASSKTVQKTDPAVMYLWMRKAMKKEYLERDVVENWVRTHLVDEVDLNLASDLIYHGKVMYLIKAAFPEMHDRLVLRYTKSQWKWAEKNEKGFWDYLMQNQMFYKNEEITKLNLFNSGPKTPGLPIDGSPDRMGKFLGYKIICDYMEETEATVAQMVKADYKKILQKYKPEE
ncbi:DUF2268 domain-containing putative Zn-dependent protease [Crocinitomicaceae bacterium]|nr:DUF2268 domain-containing putative Zn-dependent protease [Crocinitomicaceae bacterium]